MWWDTIKLLKISDLTKFLVLNYHAKHQIFNGLNTWLLDAVNKLSKITEVLNEGLLHFFKRIDVDLVPDRLHILVKTANFAGTKTQAREGLEKRFSEGKNGVFSGFCTRRIAIR